MRQIALGPQADAGEIHIEIIWGLSKVSPQLGV